MGNIWEFLLQTLTVSLAAAVLLIVKYLLTDKLSPRWQYGVWGLLALRALIPAGTARQVLLPLPVWVDMWKTAAERGLGSAYASPWSSLDAGSVLPEQNGVYAALLTLADGRALPCVLNKGRHPTLPEGAATVEAFILDFNGDLYGQRVHVDFLAFLRPETRFADKEALRAQIARDAQNARAWFAAHPL